MAHFVKLDENNIVINVLAVANAALDPENEEQSGIAFLTELYGYDKWLQTSFNNRIRGRFAGIGFSYDSLNDIFIAPQPYASWSLDENFDWQPPTPRPEGIGWYWNEEELTWKEVVND
jgi:hypothetical protein